MVGTKLEAGSRLCGFLPVPSHVVPHPKQPQASAGSIGSASSSGIAHIPPDVSNSLAGSLQDLRRDHGHCGEGSLPTPNPVPSSPSPPWGQLASGQSLEICTPLLVGARPELSEWVEEDLCGTGTRACHQSPEIPHVMGLENLKGYLCCHSLPERVVVRGCGGRGEMGRVKKLLYFIIFQHFLYLQTACKGEKDGRKNRRERRRGPGKVTALL